MKSIKYITVPTYSDMATSWESRMWIAEVCSKEILLNSQLRPIKAILFFLLVSHLSSTSNKVIFLYHIVPSLDKTQMIFLSFSLKKYAVMPTEKIP